MSESDRIDVTCPCCGTKLKVEAKSGEILAEERPVVDRSKSFDEALGQVRSAAQRRADAFSKAYDRTRRLDDLLDKKFEEAKKKAAKDDSKPHNPFDLD